MFVKSVVREFVAGLVLLATLAGCSAAPTPTPTAVPTIDPKPTLDAVSTQAAATVIAGLTQNAPTATQTSTPSPTATTGPTDTPTTTATPTRVFIPWTKTPTAVTPDWACSVLSVTPSTVAISTSFDAVWTIKNTGTKTWYSSDLDIVYASGDKLQKLTSLYDLKSTVAPGATYTVTVDMVSPSTDGAYSTTWAINFTDGTACNMTLNVSVTK